MADILIKGMEMPTTCRDCRLSTFADFDSMPFCNITMDDICLNDWETKRCDNCPLVPVPAHGRLIEEADAIETAWMILRGLGYFKEENPQLEQTVRDVFATAPAIEVE